MDCVNHRYLVGTFHFEKEPRAKFIILRVKQDDTRCLEPLFYPIDRALYQILRSGMETRLDRPKKTRARTGGGSDASLS